MSLVAYLAAVTVTPGGKFVFDGFFGGSTDSLFEKVANLLIYLVGAIAVIMVIIGGFKYVLSSGNPQATKEAKDTILNAIIGVVVSILAYAIVNFVIGKLR